VEEGDGKWKRETEKEVIAAFDFLYFYKQNIKVQQIRKIQNLGPKQFMRQQGWKLVLYSHLQTTT